MYTFLLIVKLGSPAKNVLHAPIPIYVAKLRLTDIASRASSVFRFMVHERSNHYPMKCISYIIYDIYLKFTVPKSNVAAKDSGVKS